MGSNEGWVTDRHPAFEDSDGEGDVIVSYGEGNESHCHWTSVMVGAHWKHSESWECPSHSPSKEDWITDRPPAKEDGDAEGLILTKSEYGALQYSPWNEAWKQPPWKHSPQWVNQPCGTERVESSFEQSEVGKERERCASICEAIRPHGGRAFTPEQFAVFDALSHAADCIRKGTKLEE